MKTATQILLAALTVGTTVSHAALISHWTFDESSGTTAADQTGFFPGTLSGGAAFVAGGISGNAVSLAEATSSLVNMGTGFPGFTAGDYSLVAWVNTISTDIDSFVLSKHESGTQNGYILGVNTTGGIGAANKAFFFASHGAPADNAVSTTTVNDGVWHQIVGVYHASSTLDIYVDGAPVEQSVTAQFMTANAAPFLIGGYNVGGNTPTASYTGLVDDVQVYGNALTSGEVQYLFANPGQVIPEPASAILLLAGTGLLTLKRRRTSMA